MTMVAVAYFTEKFTAPEWQTRSYTPRAGFLVLGLSRVTNRRAKQGRQIPWDQDGGREGSGREGWGFGAPGLWELTSVFFSHVWYGCCQYVNLYYDSVSVLGPRVTVEMGSDADDGSSPPIWWPGLKK